MDLNVQRLEDEHKFSARVGDDEAILTWMQLTDDLVALTHTAVPASLRGHGVGEELVHQALEDTIQRGWKFVPLCPFVQAYLRRHAQYQDFVVDLDQLEKEEEEEEP